MAEVLERYNESTQEVVLRSVRRPLLAAPSEATLAHGTGAMPAVDPTNSIGQVVGINEIGRPGPILPPTPAPTPPSLTYTPAMYTNPNHYEFANNLGGREAQTPLASIPQGKQLAYELREDWRRPAPIQPDAEVI